MGPDKAPLSSATSLASEIGVRTTLDDSPPSFSRLSIMDPLVGNARIVVNFDLNDARTAYCRASRVDSGETAADMPVARILSAGW